MKSGAGDAIAIRHPASLVRLVFCSLKTAEIDPVEVAQEVTRGVLAKVDRLLILVDDIDRQTERPELLDEDFERLWHSGFDDFFALDDRLVSLDATHDIVRLDSQHLLQDVRGAVRLERPDLHLAEA